MSFSIRIHSLLETDQLGAAIADSLCGEELVYLKGDLGVGKTALVKSVCQRLNFNAALVTSPTFTYFNLYEDKVLPDGRQTEINIFHADLYRLNHFESLNNLGFWEYVYNKKYSAFVEWADKFVQLQDLEHLNVDIFFENVMEHRRVQFTGQGIKHQDLQEKIKNALCDQGLDIL